MKDQSDSSYFFNGPESVQRPIDYSISGNAAPLLRGIASGTGAATSGYDYGICTHFDFFLGIIDGQCLALFFQATSGLRV